MSRDYHPRPAAGHMPFAGHRTVAEIWEAQERAARYRIAREYGFDPECLEAKKNG